MLPISICVIMKNEENHMDSFLGSIVNSFKDYPFELVLVDTGSTDRTVEIAKKYTDTIYHFEWINDFSAARNYSLSCAHSDWILVLDCDEYIADVDVTCFQRMAAQFPQSVGVLNRQNHYQQNGISGISADKVERFFNRKLYHYEYIIHEQVRPIDGRESYHRVELPLQVEHFGYDGDEENLRRKAMRNNELLFQMLEREPDNPYLYFQIGQSYNMMHDVEKACEYYGKGLEYDVDPRAEYVQQMVVGYGYALLDSQRFEDALQYENIYEEFCHLADFVCLMGLIYLRNGMLPQAISEFEKAPALRDVRVAGANSFIPTYNLGCIHEVLGHVDTAVALYEKCGDFPPALDRLKALRS